jgi:hypothetical protein
VLGQLELVPAAVVVRVQRAVVAGRQLDVARAVERRAFAITGREARRPRRLHHLEKPLQRRTRRVFVHRSERTVAERRPLDLQHLEQVEEDVAEVRPVVVDGRH